MQNYPMRVNKEACKSNVAFLGVAYPVLAVGFIKISEAILLNPWQYQHINQQSGLIARGLIFPSTLIESHPIV